MHAHTAVELSSSDYVYGDPPATAWTVRMQSLLRGSPSLRVRLLFADPSKKYGPMRRARVPSRLGAQLSENKWHIRSEDGRGRPYVNLPMLESIGEMKFRGIYENSTGKSANGGGAVLVGRE